MKSLHIVLLVVVACICSCSRRTDSDVYRIAAILPISGPNAAQGIGMMNSCKSAVRDISESANLGNAKLELVELDDESKADAAVRAAERAGQDPKVLAATAHWNSGPALATDPIFHRWGLANLVPAAIDSKITLGQLGDEIFRIDPNDLIILRYAAAFAASVRGWKRVFVIDDNTLYGKDLASTFVADYSGLGGKVVGQDSIQVGDRDFSALLTRIKSVKPECVFFGGVVAEAALIRRQMRTVGLQADLLSLTGIFTRSFIEAAGPAAEGAYSATVVPPTERLPGGQQFLRSYARGGFNHPSEAWGIYGYASVQVLAEAIRRALPHPSRRAVINELKKGEFETVLGRMRFDDHGQTTLVTIFVYQVRNGEWVPLFQADGKGSLMAFKE
jgi:branched-chain amino acid transport system substrate-binding protein